MYVLTTDNNGKITADLPKGNYKAVKIYENEEYILEEDEEKRTYYFNIETYKEDKNEWVKGVRGYSWNNINCSIKTNNNQIISVGTISEYSKEVTGEFYDGVDLDEDEKVEQKSSGQKDGIIIFYDENGNYLKSETLGGDDDDSCNQIIQTKDGGYIIVGYISSSIVTLNGKVIPKLSKANYEVKGKDGFILKINLDGEYEWAIRLGGNLDDEIVKIMENENGDINVIGNFCSENLNIYENDVVNNIKEKITNTGEMNAFLITYSGDGKYKWSKYTEGKERVEASSIVEMLDGFVIAINYKGIINIENQYTFNINSKHYMNSMIIKYSKEGEYLWSYDMFTVETNIYFSDKYIKISEMGVTKENNIVVAVNCAGIIKGMQSMVYTTIYSCQENGICLDLMLFSENGKFLNNIYNLNAKVSISDSAVATITCTDLIITRDNNILFCGYYYSSVNIIVDKNKVESNENDFKSAFTNGYILKIDLDGNVKFSDCMYRSNIEYSSISTINNIFEMDDEKILICGNFEWKTLTTRSLYKTYIANEMDTKYYLNRIGNTEGFLVCESMNREFKEIAISKVITVSSSRKPNITKPEVTRITELPMTGSNEKIITIIIGIISIIVGLYLINYATYIKKLPRNGTRRKMGTKNLKKILSINLILMSILSIFNLNQKSFATITEMQNQVNVNITNIEKGVSVSLYQIATAEYDYISNQPKEGYKWAEAIQEWIDTNEPEYSNTEDFYKKIENNSEEAKAFYDKLTSEIKENNIQIEVYETKTSEGEASYPVTEENLDGNITFSKVNMGTYLVLIENGYMVYTPSVVNIIPDFNSETNEWELNDKNVVVKASTPSISKTVTDDKKTVDNYSTIDDITFTIDADVPTYLKNSLSKKYCISDKLDRSLILNKETLCIFGIKAMQEPEEITDYTINFNNQSTENEKIMTFDIDFDYSRIEKFDSIKIVYKAKLASNTDLVIGKDGNCNIAYLNYSNNPYKKSSLQTQSSEKVKIYTYELDVKSTEKNDTNKALPGSEFSVINLNGEELYFVKGEDGTYYLAEKTTENATNKVEVDSNGNLCIKGLDEGEYTVKQTKAPEGYNISSKTYTIKLEDKDKDGEIDDNYNLIFPNTKGFALPVTGGKGTIAYISISMTSIGIGIMLIISISKKKKLQKQKINN